MINSFEPKKLALLRILQILEKYSDYDHPLKQSDIANYLENDYGIVMERKAISRNISLLREAGIEIESNRQGSYLLSREFENSELRMLIDGVLCSRYITAKHSKSIIERIENLSNKYFSSHTKNIYNLDVLGKSDNQQLFYSIEIIDETINSKKQIKFDYNKYGLDKKLHKSASHIVSPYQLILSNQRYYLLALNEKWQHLAFFRLDHITNILPCNESATDIRTVTGYENGIDYANIISSRPYMFSDKAENIEFIADSWMIDQIVEYFGFDFEVSKICDDKINVKLKASPNAMEHWAMQFVNYVEIIKPESLRGTIKETLINAKEKYK